MLASASALASALASAAAAGNRQHRSNFLQGNTQELTWATRAMLGRLAAKKLKCWVLTGSFVLRVLWVNIPRHYIHNAWNKARAPIADVVRFTAALASLTSICIIINHQMSSGQYVSAVLRPAKRRAGSQKDEESGLPMSAGRAKACTACRQVKVSAFGFHCSTYLFSWRDNSWSAIRPKPFQLLVLDVRARG